MITHKINQQTNFEKHWAIETQTKAIVPRLFYLDNTSEFKREKVSLPNVKDT